MTKIKAGDRVKLLETDYQEHAIGDIGTVTEVSEYGCELFVSGKFDNDSLYYLWSEIELATRFAPGDSIYWVDTMHGDRHYETVKSVDGDNIHYEAKYNGHAGWNRLSATPHFLVDAPKPPAAPKFYIGAKVAATGGRPKGLTGTIVEDHDDGLWGVEFPGWTEGHGGGSDIPGKKNRWNVREINLTPAPIAASEPNIIPATREAVVKALTDFVATLPAQDERTFERGDLVQVDDDDLFINLGVVASGPDEDGDYLIAVLSNGTPLAGHYSLNELEAA